VPTLLPATVKPQHSPVLCLGGRACPDACLCCGCTVATAALLDVNGYRLLGQGAIDQQLQYHVPDIIAVFN
jgi:hypothetical protein